MRENCVFENEGTVLMTDGDVFAYEGSQLTNATGALWDVQTNEDMNHSRGVRTQFTNNGELRKSAEGGSVSISWDVTNAGIISIQIGELNFANGFTQTDGSAAIFLTGGNLRKSGTLNLAGGVMNGIGTITGNVTNTGATIRPGSNLGNLNITGEFNQIAAGILEMDISGDVASGNFDTLTIGGTAALGGTFRLLTGAFVATAGESYDLITYVGGSGGSSFDLHQNLADQNGINFTANYLADRFTLTTSTLQAPAPGRAPLEDLLAPDQAGFEPWLDKAFGPDAHDGNSLLCGDLADPDRDGLCNLLEYAFGGHPLETTSNLIGPTQHFEWIEGERYLCLTYHRRSFAPDLQYLVEGSSDLEDWIRRDASVVETTVQPVSSSFHRVTVRWIDPVGPATPVWFLRVQVIRIGEKAAPLDHKSPKQLLPFAP